MKKGERAERRLPLDVAGRGARSRSGMFLLVFALSEGGTYGWWKPVKEFTIGGPRRVAGVAAGLDHADRARGRARDPRRGSTSSSGRRNGAATHPLFEFAHLRIKTYRYGLLTGLVLAMGQFGLSFVLPVFLQGARLLTPEQNGLWQLPTGVFIIVGAQVGGRLIRAVGTTIVVRLGLFSYAVGMLLDLARGLARHHRVAARSRARVLRHRHRVRGRAAHERRAVGDPGRELGRRERREHDGAPGRRGARRRHDRLAVERADPEPPVDAGSAPPRSRPRSKVQALAGVHAQGAFYQPPASTSPHDTSILQHALRTSVAGGTRIALVFAATVVLLGALVSFLIPRVAAPEAARGRRARARRTPRRRPHPPRRHLTPSSRPTVGGGLR